MESLRIIMVSTHYPPHHIGGDAVFVEYLAETLVDRGHDVHIFHNPIVYNLVRRNAKHGYDEGSGKSPAIHRYNSTNGIIDPVITHTLGLSSRAEQGLRNLSKAIQPDIVHWHNTRGFFSRFPSINSSVNLYTAHDYHLVCPRANLLKPDMSICVRPELCQSCLLGALKSPQLWRIGRRRVVKPPSDFRILCPSKFIAARLRDDGLTVDHVLANFVPDLRKTLTHGQIPDGEHIVYVGALEAHKGILTLIDAFDEARDDNDFNLIIIGDGILRTTLINMVMQRSLQNRVYVPGYVSKDKLIQLLSNAHALVVPSEWPENAPLVALEALSLGVPLIGSGMGGLPEIMSFNQESLMFEAGNCNHLAECLRHAWRRRGNRKAIAKSCRDVYERRFSADAHLKKYFSIIDATHGPNTSQ